MIKCLDNGDSNVEVSAALKYEKNNCRINSFKTKLNMTKRKIKIFIITSDKIKMLKNRLRIITIIIYHVSRATSQINE